MDAQIPPPSSLDALLADAIRRCAAGDITMGDAESAWTTGCAEVLRLESLVDGGWEAEQGIRLAALRSTLDALRVSMDGMRSQVSDGANGVGARRA
jgi:hypothetical protein